MEYFPFYRNDHKTVQVHTRMAAHPAMGVVEANDELLEDPARLLLSKAPMRPVAESIIEQVPSLRILHRYRQVRGRQEHLHAHAGTCPFSRAPLSISTSISTHNSRPAKHTKYGLDLRHFMIYAEHC